MYSLYHSLITQHSRQLSPARCAKSTIAQLYRFFEDVVIENNLAALVIESLPPSSERLPREVERVQKLARVAQNCFLTVSAKDTFAELVRNGNSDDPKLVVFERKDQTGISEHFVVIADANFSALLASFHSDSDSENSVGDLVVWTFEPDVVYSALEYLMAWVTAEHRSHAGTFADAVRVSTPKATSRKLTLEITTRLARLLQDQAEREIAVHRIATASRNSPNLDNVLQTAANEVGRALGVPGCVVRVQGELVGSEMTRTSFQSDGKKIGSFEEKLLGQLDAIGYRLLISPMTQVDDDDHRDTCSEFAQAAVPLIYQGKFLGFLLVRSDQADRVWAHNELMLMHTAAEQLTVAVNQAHLFAQMEKQALTDGLTGCFNRRSFDLQLERDLSFATRTRQPLTLIMLDLDNFKYINDHAGHETGDKALRMLADSLRAELRTVDTAVRFGGDEFALILPQANMEGGLIIAERLRARIEQTVIPGYGGMTASFGVATFPLHASSPETLVVAADRALYNSKNFGRNRVSTPPDEDLGSFSNEDIVVAEESLVDSLNC